MSGPKPPLFTDAIASTERAMRSEFGDDIRVVSARSIQFGDSLTKILVYGDRHAVVADLIARRMRTFGGKSDSVTTAQHDVPARGMFIGYTYSSITALEKGA